MSNRGLIARLLTIISNNRCLKMIYQLPWKLTAIAIQTLTTIFYTIIWCRWKTNICHIDMENLTNIDTRETKVKQRDTLYKELSCTNRSHAKYHLLKNKLNTFNKTLKKTMREAKLVYYRREFEYNRSNIKRTWSTINDILWKTKYSHQSVKSIISNGRMINKRHNRNRQ